MAKSYHEIVIKKRCRRISGREMFIDVLLNLKECKTECTLYCAKFFNIAILICYNTYAQKNDRKDFSTIYGIGGAEILCSPTFS